MGTCFSTKLTSTPNKFQAACEWPEIFPFHTQCTTTASQTSPDIDTTLATTMPKEQYQKKTQAKPKSGLTLVDSMVLKTVKQPDSTRPGLSTHSNSGGGGAQFNIFTQVNETQKTIALKVNNEDSWREAYRTVSAMNPSAPVGAVVFSIMPKGLGEATAVEWSTLAGRPAEASQGWSPQEEILYQALLLKRSIASAASAPADDVDHRPTSDQEMREMMEEFEEL
ncbi:hypothetical protein FALBO_1317 [Fusarium albosuccineum]|uniref:Uncharacterized protein n=1 Tax=Fusarium albosuccineum TaxID=1237068 RepID=A0A8H4PIJ1_9HYPO|nr:hypothetical protein FALBO_1317 [Fusarium albosuccineum]